MSIKIDDPRFSVAIVGSGGNNQALLDVMNASPEFQRIFEALPKTNFIIRLSEGDEVGTFFAPQSDPPSIAISPNDFRMLAGYPALFGRPDRA